MSEIDPELSRLYREASSAEPPAALDAAILAAARKRAARPRSRELSSWWRWMAPASAIATLALGVSLALLIERERPETMDEAGIRRTQPQNPPPARATEPAKPNAAERTAPAAEANKETPAASTPAQVPAPPAAQAFPAERRAKAIAPRMSAPGPAMESGVAGDAATSSLGAAAPAAPAAAGRLAPMREEAAQRSPDAWLEEIGRLKREGREQEAAQQLAEFRKAYPAHAVPQNLLSR
ncbi:MAG: hypothetical protein JJE42_06100 [Burkholderiales bacterium]|nr:hypothetical protein [Burkholderiales bacterium]